MNTGGRSHTYVVESFEDAADAGAVTGARDRLRTACRQLRSAGRSVEYLGALFVPKDELILHLFISTQADEVLDASRLATVRVERIVRSVAVGTAADGTLIVPSLLRGSAAEGRPTDPG
jgi:hypothetical protein